MCKDASFDVSNFSTFWDIPGMKPGVLTGDTAWNLLKFAKAKGFAIPAFNCTGSSTVNAVLEAGAKLGRPLIIQFSEGGSAFFAGKSLPNKNKQASVLGAVLGAHYVRNVAPAYGIPVLVHSDHCAKKLLPWFDGMLDADEEFFQNYGEPLFSSHMLDLSEEPHEVNIAICKTYLQRMATMNLILEMEIGITGGVEDGVDNSGISKDKLYSTPEDVWQVWEALAPISEKFTIAAAFGNVHGVYKPGNVKLQPELLDEFQKYGSQKVGMPKPYHFVFHGGSGSEKADINKAVSYGVVKMNVDTDTQWAYWEGLLKFYQSNEDYLQGQIGNPKGPDAPNKSYYDPRKWVRESEVSMVNRVKESCVDLKNFDQPNAVELVAACQNYAWGRPYETSIVASLCEATGRRQLDKSKNYAEMWMGTHPNGPSSVLVEGASVALKELISQDPAHWLGDDAPRGDLPYLFKVLSCNQALSIQAHPNKTLAEQLHKKFPDKYKDPNHKPEIALPLGHFKALCAFRPVAEVRGFIDTVPELKALTGDGKSGSLKELYSHLMKADAATVGEQVDALVARLQAKPEGELTAEEKIIIWLNVDYPGDVGIFSVFFLNYVEITEDQPNRFIFCAQDEPHAYLQGDCIECMALSDNVVRAGLTPKFKDVETLLSMLTYKDDLLDRLVNVGERVSPNVVKYDPPVEDFTVYEMEGGFSDAAPLVLPRASICLCVAGSFKVDFQAISSQVEEIGKGAVFFLKAGTAIQDLKSAKGAKMFIATY
eukprot:gnl/MRDRNA2_/MRDRNA2_34728_c0_seq1.p1 gnl/MRDRNA2_/MRDRNA2_34728_c0~~gnl/MRDRNA2_/MRDRNA2_34728_c0_seq1.p1  ORF type:complete len:765 (+),score=156.11 gnl/MRDRNA2_/MRDRNA2_34728_c0_seq1:94-2388(+)